MNRTIEVIRPHSRKIAIAAGCSFIVAGLNGFVAWLAKPAVDEVLIARDSLYMGMLPVAVFAVFILRGVFIAAQNYLMRSVGSKIARDLRNSVYERLLYLPMSAHSKDSSGSMISRVINDSAVIQELLAFRIRDLFIQSATLVALLGVAFYMSWSLTLMSLLILGAALYFAGKLGRRMKQVSHRAQERISDITESLSEGLLGVKIIKSFAMERREHERFSDRNQDYYRELMRSSRIAEAAALIMDFAAGLGIALVLWYGFFLAVGKTITPGEFVSFLAALLMINTPAKRLTQVHNGLVQAQAALERMDEVTNSLPESDGDIEMRGFDGIKFEGVSFKYEGKDEFALRDIDLNIKKGEVIALVGRSGSGKTTLADLCAGFYHPVSGRILVNGIDLVSIRKKSLRSLIGIVSQDVILFNETVRFNIAYGSDRPDEAAMLRASEAAFAREFIDELPEKYDTSVGQRGIRLSGGQRQRIAIARAIYKNPELLVLDEATSALDTQSEMVVQKALDGLMESATGGRRTTIVIAHRLSTIKRADRIIVLDAGRIVETGSHEELIKKSGLYRELYTLQYHGEDFK